MLYASTLNTSQFVGNNVYHSKICYAAWVVQHVWLPNVKIVVTSIKTRELLEFETRTFRILTAILTVYCDIVSFATRITAVQYLVCEWPALQKRRRRFLTDKTFDDLSIMANMQLRELAGFIRVVQILSSPLTDHYKGGKAIWTN